MKKKRKELKTIKLKTIKILKKIIKIHRIKKNSFFLNMYEMFKINVKTFEKGCIYTITVFKKIIKQFYG